MLGIPLKLPSVFPANTIKAQRVLTWLKMNDYKNVSVLTDALYEAYWGGLDLDISQDTVLVKVFEKVGGDKEWLAKADIEAVKKELKDRTDEAVALGAFGAPTMICTNSAGKTEFFFGSDRFEHVAMFLGEEWKGYSPKESKL